MMHFGIDFWEDFGVFLKEKSRHVGTKIGSGGGPGGGLEASWRPNPKKRGLRLFSGALLGPSWGALGAVLALESPSWGGFGRLGPLKNRCKNRSIFECLLESDFWKILVDFGKKTEPSWDPKTIKNRSRRYSGKTN